MNERNADEASRLAGALVSAAMRRPRLIAGLWLGVAAAATPGVMRLHVEPSSDSVLDRKGIEWATYQESIRRFGNDEDLVVAVAGSEPYEPKIIKRVLELTSALSRVKGIARVDSISTTPVISEDETGGLSIEPILTAEAFSSGSTNSLERLMRNESVRGLLVSADGRTFGIRLRVAAASEDYGELIHAVRLLAGAAGAWVSGVPVFREEATRRTRSELATLVPFTIVVIALALLSIFRSSWALMLGMAVAGVGTWLVLGVMGAAGVPVTLTMSILPSILLAIGTASSVHLLCETSGSVSPTMLSRRATRVSDPILIAGVTTSLAFLSGAMVPIDAIRYVAVFGALGALLLSVATVTLGSALLALGGSAASRPRLVDRLGDRVAPSALRSVVANPKRVLLAWALLVSLAGIGATRVSLETDVTSWFPRGGDTRDSYEEIRRRLVGISPISIVIAAAPDQSVTEPQLMARMDEFVRFLEDLPDVGKVTSISTVLKEVHEIAARSSSGGQQLPSERSLVEQYLLLLEGNEEIRELISDDHTVVNVMLRANNNGSEHLLSISENAEGWWRTRGLAGFEATATGIMFEFARAEREIAYGQLIGLTVDLLALALLYFVLFRDVRLSLIALTPSLATVGVSFGLLGLFGLPLDAGTVFVGTLALGVTVDETVHFVVGIRRGLSMGVEWGEAIEAAFCRIFPALLITTGVLALGFVVVAFSSFSLIQRLGMLTVVAMVVCVIANVTFLPALLVVGRSDARNGVEAAFK